MRPPLTRLTAALCVLFAPIALLAVPAQAQTPVTVTVNATSSLGKIPAADHGVNTTVNDYAMADPAVPGLLQNIGMNALRYPGGIIADTFHWTNDTTVDGHGKVTDWTPFNTTFDQFMTLANKVGASPVITVNYLTNTSGAYNSASDPTEAAAWVNYANIQKNYGIKYWEIGNEEWGEGEYNNQVGGYQGDSTTVFNPIHYGKAVVSYANAMKAQDKTIKIGVVLTNPGQYPDNYGPDWNSNVLAQCGSSVDFVILHYYPIATLLPADAQLLSAPAPQIPLLVAKTRALINQYCGTNAPNVQILITETSSTGSSGTKQVINLVNSLFVADETQMWLENGISNVDFWNLHGGIYLKRDSNGNLVTDSHGVGLIQDNFLDAGIPDNNYGNIPYADSGLLSANFWPGVLPPYSSDTVITEPNTDTTPFPTYYGEQMVGLLGSPGDCMVSSTANQPLVSSHAVRNSNGSLSVMLINKDPSTTYAANVTVKGYSNSWTAPSTTYFYGETSSSVSSSSGTAGSSFSQSLPPYSITTVVLNAAPSSPVLAASVTPAVLTIAPGAAPTLTALVTNYGSNLSGTTVNMSVYDQYGKQAGSTQPLTGQSFNAGSTQQPCGFTWTPPAAASGTYTVSFSVMDSTGNLQYSGSNLATIQVAPNALIPTAPSFAESALISPTTIMEGQTATITLTLTDIGAPVTDATIVGGTWGSSNQTLNPLSGQNWFYGQTNTYTYLWTAPNYTGTSHLQVAAGPPDNDGYHSYPGNYGQFPLINVVAYVAPAMAVAGTVDQSVLAPGAATILRATTTDAGGPLTNGTAYVEVHDPNNNIILTQKTAGLNWSTNQSITYSPITWTAPSTPGTYTVWVGVMDSSGTVDVHNSVATITVTPQNPNPGYTSTSSASPASVPAGTVSTISASITDQSDPLSNGVTNIVIYNTATNRPIFSYSYTGQNWTSGSTLKYSYSWTVPSTPGTYQVYFTMQNAAQNHTYTFMGGPQITVTAPTITAGNFGFETPSYGQWQYVYNPAGAYWNFVGSSGIACANSAFNNPPAPQGTQVAFVQGGGPGGGVISQTITSAVPGTWTISLSAAQRTNNHQTVAVQLDGKTIGTIAATSSAFAPYSVTAPAVVPAGAHTLAFAGQQQNGDNTAFIDNVQVTSH